MDKATALKSAREKMDRIVGGVQKDLGKIRTGKASVDMLADIRADYYGTQTPLNQMAGLTVSDAKTIVISPWDASAIGAIEKAIQQSELGLNPMNDGKVIRIVVPPLSEERRKELVKVARAAAEEGRVHIRNVRREANEQLKALQKDGGLSEDDLKRSETEVQKLTDEEIKKIDLLLARKEKETLAI